VAVRAAAVPAIQAPAVARTGLPVIRPVAVRADLLVVLAVVLAALAQAAPAPAVPAAVVAPAAAVAPAAVVARVVPAAVLLVGVVRRALEFQHERSHPSRRSSGPGGTGQSAERRT